MKQFHGFYKKHSFFEGWYLKHRRGNDSIAFIPAFHLDKKGNPSCSLQVITRDGSWSIPYPVSSLEVNPSFFDVRLGKNHFSESGIVLDIQSEPLTVKGRIRYGNLIPLESDVMGPFCHISCMQCNHGVISLAHSLKGTLTVNGTLLPLTGGIGYIEKDWGSSFPQSYVWTQCNWIDEVTHQPACVMVSIADIPFFPKSFTGCLAVIYFGGREYRLATYHRVRILENTSQEILLQQGDYLLHINLLKEDPKPLSAPASGSMSRSVHESISCTVRYQFYVKKRKLFDMIHPHASFERA